MEPLSFTEVGDILGLICRLDCDTFELVYGDLKISVQRTGNGAAQGEGPAPGESPVQGEGPVQGDGVPGPAGVPVTAPMTGTFYRSPAPGDPPFVREGDEAEAGQTVALIEVMKLFTELKAETGGTVTRIGAEDRSLVEYGQPLMWIEPR